MNRPHRLLRPAAGMLAACLAISCGDEGSGVFGEYQGVYSLVDKTRNEVDCATPGPSVLAGETDKMLAAVTLSFFGTSMLTMHPCADPAGCRATAATARAGNVIPIGEGYVLDGTKNGALTGSLVVAGGSGTTCDGRVTEHTLTRAADKSITIESRTTLTGSFAKDGDGFCTTDGARAAVKGKPCAALGVVTAVFVEAVK